MSEHTKGRVRYTSGRLPRVFTNDRTVANVAAVPSREQRVANARRIAALWNMAEDLGLSTEAIEAGAIRDLYEACKTILASAHWHHRDEHFIVSKPAFDAMVAALAKAEGMTP